MNNYEKILNYANKNNGYITLDDAKTISVNRFFFTKLVDNKKIEKVASGIYKLIDAPIDNFYIVSKCSKNMAYSYATSLYLHNLTDRVPLVLDITVPYNYSGYLSKNKNVSLKYVSNDIFELGIENIKTINGLDVKCYNIERTICDMVKEKDKIDREIYTKALKKYASRKDKNLLNLVKYAKTLGVEKQIVDIMGVLL